MVGLTLFHMMEAIVFSFLFYGYIGLVYKYANRYKEKYITYLNDEELSNDEQSNILHLFYDISFITTPLGGKVFTSILTFIKTPTKFYKLPTKVFLAISFILYLIVFFFAFEIVIWEIFGIWYGDKVIPLPFGLENYIISE